MDELIRAMTEAGYQSFMIQRSKKLVAELERRDVHGTDKFVRKLLGRTDDRQEYLDIFVEGQFAVVLARNGFSQIHIECSRSGPDLRANYNRQTVYFEVTRRRPNEEDNWEQSVASFAATDSAQAIISKIEGKLGQLLRGERNIVVYWSSTVRVGHPELQDAFSYVQQAIDADPRLYHKLSGILFTAGGGVNLSTLEQFYLFRNNKASEPLGIRLATKLKSLHEEDLKKLERQRKALLERVQAIKQRDELLNN
jgi:hypothetical protein